MTETSYDLIFRVDDLDRDIWRCRVDNLELLAGMIAGSLGVIRKLNNEYPDRKYTLETSADISNYQIETQVEEENIPLYSNARLNRGEYGLWVNSSRRCLYNLYRFKTPAFVQGIVTICNHFEVDFRDFIFNLIFDQDGNTYILENYVMTQYELSMDVEESSDVEEEQRDDENVIQPLDGFQEDEWDRQ